MPVSKRKPSVSKGKVKIVSKPQTSDAAIQRAISALEDIHADLEDEQMELEDRRDQLLNQIRAIEDAVVNLEEI
jgi:hypothetical protein